MLPKTTVRKTARTKNRQDGNQTSFYDRKNSIEDRLIAKIDRERNQQEAKQQKKGA